MKTETKKLLGVLFKVLHLKFGETPRSFKIVCDKPGCFLIALEEYREKQKRVYKVIGEEK